VKRVLLVLALVLVMAAAAAPAALARQHFVCYQISSGDLVVFRCLPSKKACEQAQATDPAALGPCIKEKNF
jgi:hypothetical protein